MPTPNILVSAAALRTSGARTIYRQFIEHLKTRVDGNHYYIMVDKDMEMPPIAGVSYWIVDISSKAKRLMFELWGFKRLLKEKAIDFDAVISLQNLGIRRLRHLPQFIYYHQPLPFFDYKWNPLKKKELVMMFYKNLYPYIVRHSIGQHAEMIVQLPSIKRGVVSRYGLEEKHVHVLFPDLEKIEIDDIVAYEYEKGTTNFIFPATSAPYKGHLFLKEVMQHLWQMEEQVAQSVRIHLTLNELEGERMLKDMADERAKQNFVFHGVVSHQELLSMYKSSGGLLFPSVIETLGLPLIEAARFGRPIIACDLEYAHEVLGDYLGATFVPSRSIDNWAQAMIKIARANKSYACLQQPQRSTWEYFFDIVDKAKA